MKLTKLLKDIELAERINFSDIEIKGITDNTKELKNGFVFIAKQGAVFDSHSLIDEAIELGARVIIHKKVIEPRKNAIYLRLSEKTDTNKAIIQLCKNYYNNPSKKLTIIGITGTNGKTTTSLLIRNILKAAGYKSLLIGTICAYLADKKIKIENTTPGAFVLYKLFNLAVQKNIKYVVMEVSSHSISQNRFDLSEVDFAIYTNLTQDHLDYHQTMENYAEAKAGLFRQMNNCGVAIINTDDNYSVKMLEASVNKKILTYGLNEKADIRFSNIDCTISKTNFEIIAKNKKLKVSSNLIGLHNVYNIVAAYCVSHLLKISDAQFLKGIKNSKKIDGRLDKVSNRLKLNIFVDYAHTPDALHNVLNALNNLKKDGTRLITVFGCGGNRDKLKRPLMGRIVVEKSDVAIITSDNPRKEEPRAIIDDILKGCAGAENYIVEVDRRKGISKALEIARAGDIILIAGKGHETYQIIGDRILNFDDRKVVKELLKKF